MRPQPGSSRLLLSLAAALALAGCSALFGSTPPHLYRVTPKSTYPVGLPHIAGQLLIETPVAPAGIDSARIALSRSPVSIDYFADSEWTDRVPALLQTALLESFENSKAITAVDREATALRADFVLRTEIRHFEAVYDSAKGPPQVWVSINATLVGSPQGTIIGQTAVEQRQRAAANEVPQIVVAFDEALGRVMQRIVVWTVDNPALSAPQR